MSDLWDLRAATRTLSPGDCPTITTDQATRPLIVDEAPVQIQQNPFPYGGLFVVLRSQLTSNEFSLLMPAHDEPTPRLISPSNPNGEAIHSINLDDNSAIVGTTASDLGIPLREL